MRNIQGRISITADPAFFLCGSAALHRGVISVERVFRGLPVYGTKQAGTKTICDRLRLTNSLVPASISRRGLL